MVCIVDLWKVRNGALTWYSSQWCSAGMEVGASAADRSVALGVEDLRKRSGAASEFSQQNFWRLTCGSRTITCACDEICAWCEISGGRGVWKKSASERTLCVPASAAMHELRAVIAFMYGFSAVLGKYQSATCSCNDSGVNAEASL